VARPAAKIAVSKGGELTPIERLLDPMNDERLSRAQQAAIARTRAVFPPKAETDTPGATFVLIFARRSDR
jgi:hypothetical protein